MELRRATKDQATPAVSALCSHPSALCMLGEGVPGLGQALRDAVGIPHSVNPRLLSVVSRGLGAGIPGLPLGVLELAGGPSPRGRRAGALKEKGEGCTCVLKRASK